MINLHHGSYRQSLVKFKDFSRTCEVLFYSFQLLKEYKKIFIFKFYNEIMLLNYSIKMFCHYLVQHMLHQIKAKYIYANLGLQKKG